MTQCIKIGAHIYVEQYGEYVYTDLFQTGNCYHFIVLTDRHRSRQPLAHDLNLTIGHTDMPLRDGRELVVEIANCSEFSYDGEPIALKGA